jgi:hypothetical protein
LAGVEFVAATCSAGLRSEAKEVRAELPGLGIGAIALRPCIRIKPEEAEVLGKTSDGEPVFVRRALGRGQVYFLADPIEMADDEPTAAARRRLYAAFLRAAGRDGATGIAPLGVTPHEPWLHVMAQPTAHGTVHVLYNTKSTPGTAAVTIPTAAGRLTLNTRNRWPALAAVTAKGAVVAVNAYGKASVGGETLLEGAGLKALLSLDGNDLRRARAILVAPFEPGRLELPPRAVAVERTSAVERSPDRSTVATQGLHGSGDLRSQNRRGQETSAERVASAERVVALIGEFRNGIWTTLERVPLEAGKTCLDLDADRATCLILVCPAVESQRWSDRLTQAMLRPDQIDGY